MLRTNSSRTLAVLVAVMAAACVAVLAGISNASAQGTNTIIVNSTDDENTPSDGKCSLREAIQNANDNAQTFSDCKAGGGKDSIRFKKGLSGTITLTPSLGPLSVTDPAGLNINGRQESITVSGDDQIQVFYTDTNAKLAVKNLTVADGFANDQNNPNGVGDRGGGIVNNGGTLTVTRSTFSGNNALFIGGGIANVNGGTLKVTNSTFSSNRAGAAGGAIVNDGTFELTYSTFSGNDAEFVGGAIENANVATARAMLSNTIFADSANGNIHQACAQGNCQGTITDGGYNISDDSSFDFTDPTSKDSTDPLLSPQGLKNRGGPTETIAITSNSPAINAIPKGENNCGTEITTDQRGVKRPQGKGCDIGAFEKKQRR